MLFLHQFKKEIVLVLNVSVTGGQSGTSYNANIAVVLPSPLGTTYSKIVALGTANAEGTANAQVTFPDSSFQPSGSLTDYAGTYTVYFNQSQSLAQNTFRSKLYRFNNIP